MKAGIRGAERVIKVFFVFISGLLFLLRAAEAATLSDVSGKVFFLGAKSDSKSWDVVASGFVLSPGDQIRTEPGARAVVLFDDGSKVEIGPNGAFTLQEAGPQASSLLLSLGRLKAWVNKRLDQQFRVRTPTAVCSVRGTEFGVDVGPQGDTSVRMFSGLLAVADLQGNEILLKDNQSVDVTQTGLGAVQAGEGSSAQDKAKEAARRELGLEMTKEQVQAIAALEQKDAIYQQGKAIIDVNGNRVRIEEYIVRPEPNVFKLVVLNDRADRFDYFYYKGTFNQNLPNDISVALRQLPGCIGGPCQYFLTRYDTGRSNTIDNMLEIATGGHLVDVNNNGVAADAVTAAFDPAADRFVPIPVLAPGQNNPALNTPFFKTLYNTNSLTFNGVLHSGWTPSAAGLARPGGDILNMAGDINLNLVTSVQFPPNCGPPDCTFTENGVLHQVVYASSVNGDIWEKYDNYIISDEGKIATFQDFAGQTSGTQYKQTLLNWNFQTIVTASEFGGRKIDLAVEPKIFIQSGLIQ